MNNRALLTILPAIMLFLSGPAYPAEFFDEAEVLRSEPLTTIRHSRHLAYECFNRPETDDLIELLHWDLGTGHCSVEETTETITGYRVYYEWDDQVLSHVMSEVPGSHIPVRVEVY
ncbi:MAG: hypothetical protein CMQ20_08100 [Gammaproteobacteria bacterium]|jgi:uncharacterized protein YcfJ|nr:hypothetical protein [Gammaproteobacteria bacterium]